MDDLARYAQAFLMAKDAGQRSKATLKWYSSNFAAYFSWAATMEYSEVDLYQIDTLEEFFSASSEEGLSPHSVWSRFRTLRALFRWLEKRGKLNEDNPFNFIEFKKPGGLLPKAIPYAEMLKLLLSLKGDNWHTQRDRLLIQVLFYTGVRLSELCRMRIDDVNIDRRLIRVTRAKTGIEEFVPYPKSLADEMRRWIEMIRPICATNALWPASEFDGAPIWAIASGGVAEMLRRRCKAAKLKHYTAHTFRHGCAVYMIERGGDLSLVKDVLGHRSVETTIIYLRFSTDKLLSLYDRVFA